VSSKDSDMLTCWFLIISNRIDFPWFLWIRLVDIFVIVLGMSSSEFRRSLSIYDVYFEDENGINYCMDNDTNKNDDIIIGVLVNNLEIEAKKNY
jgi:hypothetical protein